MAKNGNDDKRFPAMNNGEAPPAAGIGLDKEKTLEELMDDLSRMENPEINPREQVPLENTPIQTFCPDCQTGFDVTNELLASIDTRVRCGECLNIFDALTNLQQDDPVEDDPSVGKDAQDSYPDTPASATDDTGPGASLPEDEEASSPLDTKKSDFDLFSGAAELPEIPYFDQTIVTDGLAFEEHDSDEIHGLDDSYNEAITEGETVGDPEVLDTVTSAESIDNGESVLADEPMPAPDAYAAKVDYLTDEVPRDPLRFNYRESETRQMDAHTRAQSGVLPDAPNIGNMPRQKNATPVDRKRRVWLKRSLLALLLLVIAGAMYGYRFRDDLLSNQSLRPVLQQVCSIVGCKLPPLVDLDALTVVKRTVYSHPTIDNALVIDLAFINKAPFKQPYPILEVRLTNRAGGLVKQNDVAPASYLEQWEAGDSIASGERLDLNLTVEDPGQTASSFELKFR